MDWSQLSIDANGLDCDRLLSSWRWLVTRELLPFSLTMFGDWFFEDAQGRVVFLDTVSGELSVIAQSRSEFDLERLKQDNLDHWYMADLAMLCFERGLRPGSRECLSFKIPPILSGPLDADNVEVCDLAVHLGILGQIHRQVKDVPAGTPIRGFTVDGIEP